MRASDQANLLVVGDWPRYAPLVHSLSEAGFNYNQALSLEQAAEALDEPAGVAYSAVIVHQAGAGNKLVDFCRNARSAYPDLVIIPMLIRRVEQLEHKLWDCWVDDVVIESDQPTAVAKRLAVRLADRCRMRPSCYQNRGGRS